MAPAIACVLTDDAADGRSAAELRALWQVHTYVSEQRLVVEVHQCQESVVSHQTNNELQPCREPHEPERNEREAEPWAPVEDGTQAATQSAAAETPRCVLLVTFTREFTGGHTWVIPSELLLALRSWRRTETQREDH